MRFHCLMVLRDEEDIIAQNLAHLLTWADGIYVLDLGSTDATWDIVNQFARDDRRVVPYRQWPLVFSDNLRGLVFQQFRERFDPGDWILRVDADEFYHVPPPQFVRERLRPLETAVWLQWYYFRLLRQEVADYESGKVDVLQDRKRPISDRRRYYKTSLYGEPRMFRYRSLMKWPHTASFPFNAGFVARERIPIRHYPHRDSLQMETRFRLRATMMKLHASAGSHWKLEDWRAELVDAAGTADSSIGTKRGLAGEHGIDSGQLHFWVPGTQLQETPLHNHLDRPIMRMVQRLIHPAMLPILDRGRAAWDQTYVPAELPEHVRLALGIKPAVMRSQSQTDISHRS